MPESALCAGCGGGDSDAKIATRSWRTLGEDSVVHLNARLWKSPQASDSARKSGLSVAKEELYENGPYAALPPV